MARSLVPNFWLDSVFAPHPRLGDYQPCEKPGPGEALVDLYNDGSMIMCVPLDALASLTASGARVISYGATLSRPPQSGGATPAPTINPLPRPVASGFSLGGMMPLLLIGVAAFVMLKR